MHARYAQEVEAGDKDGRRDTGKGEVMLQRLVITVDMDRVSPGGFPAG